MSFGKMNTFIDIVEPRKTKDSEGFAATEDVVVASLRAYRGGAARQREMGEPRRLFLCHGPFPVPDNSRTGGHA